MPWRIGSLVPVVAMSAVAIAAMLAILWQGGLRPDGVWILAALPACAVIGALGTLAIARAAAETRAQMRLGDAVRGLETLLAEKDQLLGEVHHRVNNNLQMVITLLHLEADQTADAGLGRHLERLARRMALIGRIHARIYAADNLARLDIGACLADHCRTVKAVWQGDDLRCGVEAALPLALIAEEMLGGDPPGDCGLHLERRGGEVLLSVRRPSGRDCSGQRMPLIRMLAQQIGATVDGSLVRIPGSLFHH